MVQPSSYAEVGWLSYLSYSWLNPLMQMGVQRQVQFEDTPMLAAQEDTVRNSRLLVTLLSRQERAGLRHPLLRAVVLAFWPQILVMQLLGIVQHFLALASPLLLQRILVFQEAQNSAAAGAAASSAAGASTAAPPRTLEPHEVHAGLAACAGYILLGIFTIFLASQVSFYQARLGLRIGSALRGAVLVRCIQGGLPQLERGDGEAAAGGQSSVGKSAPAVYNVISFDITPNIDIIWVILSIWSFPLKFSAAVVALFWQVQYAIVPGLVVVLIAELICGILYYKDGCYRHQLLAAKDLRLGSCNEAFNGVRTLQMLAWTETFEDQILVAREEELRVQNLRLWMQKMVAALSYTLTAAVTLVTLAYFVLHDGGELKASLALPLIGLVGGLIGPLSQFPTWVNNYLVWRSAYDRVNQYMGLKAYPKRQPGRGRAHDARDEEDGGHQRGALLPTKLKGNCWQVVSGAEVATRAQAPGRQQLLQLGTGTTVAAYERCSATWAASLPACEETTHMVEDREHGEEEEQRLLLGPEKVPAVLKDLDLEVRGGDLCVVLGTEGQGKSSLLCGLLGEMPLLAGAVRSPAIARYDIEANEAWRLPSTVEGARHRLAASAAGEGLADASMHSVGFAPQEPAIYTGSVRWNITFGLRFDERIYQHVVNACALNRDFSAMPAGDLTEVSQGGATLSGGQKARVSLARAVYFAAVVQQQQDLQGPGRGSPPPLLLLDDPLCALDRVVAGEVATALFARPTGLLARCAVVVTTADPWWLARVAASPAPREGSSSIRVAVLRKGQVEAAGSLEELRGLELPELAPCWQQQQQQQQQQHPGGGEVAGSLQQRSNRCTNPQDDDGEEDDGPAPEAPRQLPDGQLLAATRAAIKLAEVETQTDLPEADKNRSKVLQEEHREQGHVKGYTYKVYLESIGYGLVTWTVLALCGIMVFQELTTLWITYWVSDSRDTNFLSPYVRFFFNPVPTGTYWLLWVYTGLLVVFAFFNFAGHILEIVGGIRAARKLFREALHGTLAKPFRWWDANPPGRVLNRFSEDVQVMDNAITNILGIIMGAVLYFVGHVFILAIANPLSLGLLPLIALGFEYIAKFYRQTIREVHRINLVKMSSLYQGMVEAIVNSTTIRALGASQTVICASLDSLEQYMRISFTKQTVGIWIGLRMGLIGYTLACANTLYPVLQYFGLINPQSAALVGFSITYSSGVSAIIQQFIMNFSDLEMQLVSIERLKEYATGIDDGRMRGSPAEQILDMNRGSGQGLALRHVVVTYREGLLPALRGISLAFPPREVCAVVGRTGAGKSSLLLAVLQLVPYTGHIMLDGRLLGEMVPAEVRRDLVGVVPQHPVIFAGSIRWNLDPMDQHSAAELMDALKAVGLESVYKEEQGGLEAQLGAAATSPTATVQGEGAEESPARPQEVGSVALSQGQKQLLCAARVLLRRPRVAMLDEVSASLAADLATSTVKVLLANFMAINAASLLVTHQVELISLCDRVVTIADGLVISDRRTATAA